MSQAYRSQEAIASLSQSGRKALSRSGDKAPLPLAEATGARVTDLLAWLTIERALYIVALAAGLFLRFWQLGASPLSSLELSNSWPAWLVANGRTVADAPIPSSALFYGVQWLLFWVGADGDAAARFATAAAGSLLALLPWAWRGWIGRIAAATLAFLIALDPWLVAFSRLADGAILGIGLGLLVLTALIQLASPALATAVASDRSEHEVDAERHADGASPDRAHPTRAGLWLRIAAVAAGLLLVSGVMAWPWLLVLAGFAWVYRVELRTAGLFTPPLLGWAALAAVLGGTMGLARLDALPLAGTSLGLWLAHFGGAGYLAGSSAGAALRDAAGIGDYGVLWPWLRLIVDQPFILVAGIAGLFLSFRRQDADRRWHALVVVWLCAALLLWLLPGRSPYLLPIAGFPLMIFAASFVQALVRATPQDMVWREALAVAATLTILVVSGSFWNTALVSSRVYDPVMAQATGVIFALALGIIVAYAFWSDRRHALWIAAAFTAVMLSLVVIRSGWQLNQVDGPLYQSGFFSRTTHPEVRLLVEDIETLSAIRTGNPHELPIQVQVTSQTAGPLALPARPDPILGWYLRAMRSLTWVPAPSVGEGEDETTSAPQPLAVTLVDATVESAAGNSGDEARMRYNLPEEYAGSIYHVEAWWLPAVLVPSEPDMERPNSGGFAAAWTEWVQPALRWLIYRRTPALPPTRDVVLWARL